RAEEAHVAHLDRLAPADRSGDERHRNLRAGPADDLAVTLAVNPVERVREAVRVALAADLAVGDDVDSGALLVADRDDRRVVLRLLEMLGRYSPELADADARCHELREERTIDEPVGLRIAADDGGAHN